MDEITMFYVKVPAEVKMSDLKETWKIDSTTSKYPGGTCCTFGCHNDNNDAKWSYETTDPCMGYCYVHFMPSQHYMVVGEYSCNDELKRNMITYLNNLLSQSSGKLIKDLEPIQVQMEYQKAPWESS